MLGKSLSTRNVQAIIPVDAHKVLRDASYSKGIPLRDLIKEILIEYARKSAISRT